MRQFIERYTTNPIRGLGRMARGNVRQGLRDMAPAAQVAAMFVPGGQAASAGLGALAGALGQERGASASQIGLGALGGAGTAMAGRFAQQGFRAGMADGGGIGGGIKGVFTGAGRTPGTPPVPGETPPASMLSRAGKFATENPELSAGIARGAGTAFAGAQQADVARGQLELATRQQEEREREAQEERERRQRVAQLLAPLFQQMAQRQGLNYG